MSPDNAYAFDATAVEPSKPFDVIPAGWYRAFITGSEVKPTAAGNGRYIEFTWKILDGEHEGRVIWDRLNVVNENAQAKEIAERALSAICHATGVLKMQFTDQLHFKPCLIKLTVKKQSGYEDKNEVRGYKGADANGPPNTPVNRAPERAATDVLKDDDDDLPF